MSLLIKGMKMPKENELLCIRIYPSGKVTVDMDLQCKQVAEAVELPDHGDLIDRDAFIGRQQSWALLIAMGHGDDDEWVKCIGEICAHLYDAPVIIPAERSEE